MHHANTVDRINNRRLSNDLHIITLRVASRTDVRHVRALYQVRYLARAALTQLCHHIRAQRRASLEMIH